MSRLDQGTRLVVRSDLRLRLDCSRVIVLPFIPGEEMPGGDSCAVSVAERILAMDEPEVKATLAELEERFAHRHRRLREKWSRHFALAARRLGNTDQVSPEKALLIGAYFTREVSVEAAALFNPSIVAHVDQSGLGEGEVRFVMSLRAVSEGHLSAIEFRTGTVDADNNVRVDDPGPFLDRGLHWPGPTAGTSFMPSWPSVVVTTKRPPSCSTSWSLTSAGAAWTTPSPRCTATLWAGRR